MTGVVYDAGALAAADRGERPVWAQHRSWLTRGIVPALPAPVLAQVSRSPTQAQLRRFLRGCDVVPMDQPMAHAVGALLAASRTTDIVDATVVLMARTLSATVVTADSRDIVHLADAGGVPLRILDV